ncbi:MAG: hypothetical protein DIU80_015590 [Chloroflexota bacterium]|mgnify:CR=1 FL=1
MRAERLPRLWLVACCLTAVLLAGVLGSLPARAATEVLYVPATGHYMRGVFRDFWDRNGGLDNFGYPITEEYIDPASGRVIQYFERARFERASPEATTVELGMLGREALGDRTFPRAQPIANSATRRYFSETGQIVQYGFKEIWETRGGLAIFGLPLSGEITETTDDGEARTVQYFERARFEYHPQLPPGRRVLLSVLGRRFAPPELTAPLAPNAPPPGPLTITPEQASNEEEDADDSGLVRQLVPPAVNGTMNPLAGSPGQTFAFAPTAGYNAGETVSVWANPTGGTPVFVGRFRADNEGAIAPVFFTPPASAQLGEWAIVAEGNTSKRQAIGYFLLISGPIGRIAAAPTPPPPTPGPPVPANVNATVAPRSGPPGTVFFFNASGFQPGEEVQIAIIASDGQQTGAEPVKADQSGSLRYAGLFYASPRDTPLGLYRMVAYGTTSNRTSTAYFVLTP